MNYYDIAFGLIIWGGFSLGIYYIVKDKLLKYCILSFVLGIIIIGYPLQLELDDREKSNDNLYNSLEEVSKDYCEIQNKTFQSFIMDEDSTYYKNKIIVKCKKK